MSPLLVKTPIIFTFQSSVSGREGVGMICRRESPDPRIENHQSKGTMMETWALPPWLTLTTTTVTLQCNAGTAAQRHTHECIGFPPMTNFLLLETLEVGNQKHLSAIILCHHNTLAHSRFKRALKQCLVLKLSHFLIVTQRFVNLECGHLWAARQLHQQDIFSK